MSTDIQCEAELGVAIVLQQRRVNEAKAAIDRLRAERAQVDLAVSLAQDTCFAESDALYKLLDTVA